MLKKVLFKEISTRLFMTITLFVFSLAVTGISVVEARVNNNDIVQAPAQLQDNVSSIIAINATTTASSVVLVDLSDTTNFKHFNTSGAIEVSQIRINWSSDVVATTTLKFGVIASTTSAGNLVDVYWFDTVSFSTYAAAPFNGRQEKVLNYQPSAMKLGITSALPNGFLTGDSNTSSNLFATTSTISSPVGNQTSGSKPGVGDLVMRIYDQKGTATTSVQTIYRVK